MYEEKWKTLTRENCKTYLKDIKDDWNWVIWPSALVGRLNIDKDANFLQIIYKLNVITIKVLSEFFPK